MTRLGVLLSGRGSNFRAVHEAIVSGQIADAEIVMVGSHKPDAPGLTLAQEKGLNTLVVPAKAFATPEAYDQELLFHLQQAGVEVLLLAGYLKILTPVLIYAYPNRILNIHPSLLPAYGGKGMYGHHVHSAVLAAKDTQSGCSVHLVTSGIDEGPVLAQAMVQTLPDDTVESLSQRVLAEEHRLFPQTVARFLRGEFPQYYQPRGETACIHTP